MNSNVLYSDNSTGDFKFMELDKFKICYQETGHGDQTLLVLHTFRTQIEHAQRIVPLLSEHFRIYLIDLPGHGRSSKPIDKDMDCRFFVESVKAFIEELDLTQVTVAGESIGGTIALGLAAEIPERLAAIYAYNPYDYPSSVIGGFFGRQVTFFSRFTTLFIRLGISPVLRLVFSAGFRDRQNIPKGYMKLLATIPTKDKAFPKCLQSIIIHSPSWSQTADNLYSKISASFSIHVIYGDHDWGPANSTERNIHRLGNKAQFHQLKDTGHFSFLDNPKGVADIILNATIV